MRLFLLILIGTVFTGSKGQKEELKRTKDQLASERKSKKIVEEKVNQLKKEKEDLMREADDKTIRIEYQEQRNSDQIKRIVGFVAENKILKEKVQDKIKELNEMTEGKANERVKLDARDDAEREKQAAWASARKEIAKAEDLQKKAEIEIWKANHKWQDAEDLKRRLEDEIRRKVAERTADLERKTKGAIDAAEDEKNAALNAKRRADEKENKIIERERNADGQVQGAYDETRRKEEDISRLNDEARKLENEKYLLLTNLWKQSRYNNPPKRTCGSTSYSSSRRKSGTFGSSSRSSSSSGGDNYGSTNFSSSNHVKGNMDKGGEGKGK